MFLLSGTSKSARAGAAEPRAAALLALCLLCAGASVRAEVPPPQEPPEVSVSVEPETARVGAPITMRVTVTHAPGLRWEPKSAGDHLGSFDIEQIEGPKTAAPAGGAKLPHGRERTTWVFRLRAYDLGELEIPSFELHYHGRDSSEIHSVATPARKITIEPTITNPKASPADIRSGFTLPEVLHLLAWGLGAAAALLAGAGLWWWIRRRRRRAAAAVPAPAKPAPPRRPAYDRYLEALEALLAENLAGSGRFKELHIRMSEIVKGYLGEVYAFDATERTSEEVMEDLGRVARPSVRSETSLFLGQCDLVKFAEHAPGGDECAESARRARKILDMSRPAGSAP